MSFNSVEFAVFLTVVLALHHGVLRRAPWPARKAFLAMASFAFYASWNPFMVLLMVGSTLLDFRLGLWIEAARGVRRRKALVAVSCAYNLGVLACFKYGDFATRTAWQLAGWTDDPPLVDLVLPIGISFYTFESLSYVIDVYRGAPAYRRPADFALFLSFFPHLVAGPIVRPGAFLPQLRTAPRIDPRALEPAIARIVAGFTKKLVFADGLGQYVDRVWSLPHGYPWGNVWLAVYAYAFQIYFDFSGYTDIALGVAALFGFTLPENFDRPYRAVSPREFWTRWHVSLSSWLRDYLYVPLGGNRRGRVRTYVNLLITMVLGGLWHGAAWTFVAWGFAHGAWLAVHRAIRERGAPPRTPAWVRRLATFHLVCLAWVPFRAPGVFDASQIVRGLWRTDVAFTPEMREIVVNGHVSTSTGFWVSSPEAVWALVLLAMAVALHAAPRASRWRVRLASLPPTVQGVVYAAILLFVFLNAPAGTRFIYFQF